MKLLTGWRTLHLALPGAGLGCLSTLISNSNIGNIYQPEISNEFSQGESFQHFVVVMSRLCLHVYIMLWLLIFIQIYSWFKTLGCFVSLTSGNCCLYICTCGREAVRCSTVIRIESKMSHAGVWLFLILTCQNIGL